MKIPGFFVHSFSKLRDLHLIALVGADSVAILDEPKLSEIAKVS